MENKTIFKKNCLLQNAWTPIWLTPDRMVLYSNLQNYVKKQQGQQNLSQVLGAFTSFYGNVTYVSNIPLIASCVH